MLARVFLSLFMIASTVAHANPHVVPAHDSVLLATCDDNTATSNEVRSIKSLVVYAHVGKVSKRVNLVTYEGVELIRASKNSVLYSSFTGLLRLSGFGGIGLVQENFGKHAQLMGKGAQKHNPESKPQQEIDLINLVPREARVSAKFKGRQVVKAESCKFDKNGFETLKAR